MCDAFCHLVAAPAASKSRPRPWRKAVLLDLVEDEAVVLLLPGRHEQKLGGVSWRLKYCRMPSLVFGLVQYPSQRGIALPCLPCKNDYFTTPLVCLGYAARVSQTGIKAQAA